MSPQGGDDPASPDSSRPGGLAGVFRGLTTSRSNRSLPLSSSSSSVALPVAELVNATPTTVSKLSPHAMDSFDLLKNGNLGDRIAAATTLKYAISEYPLNPVLDIWYAAKDLIESGKPPAARTAGWELMTECVKHDSSTDLERKEYFQTLAAPAHPEDFHLQLAALVDLTRSGRVLDGFDYDLLPLLTVWLQEAYATVRTARKVASSTSKASRGTAKNKTAASGEEKNFAQLFVFLTDVIKFSFKCADDTSLNGLIDGLLSICATTSVEDDLRSCIGVLSTIVTFGYIPNEKLKDCVQVLSSIYCLVAALAKEAWHTLANIFRSHNGQAVVRILLDLLRGLPADAVKEKDMSREIRASLAVIQKLLAKSTEKGYPTVPYALLADGLSSTIKCSPSPRVQLAILQVINCLFTDSRNNLHRLIVDEDWSAVLDVAAECGEKIIEAEDSTPRHHFREERSEDPLTKEMQQLIRRLEALIRPEDNQAFKQKDDEFVPRQTVVQFFVKVQSLLPDSTACAVMDYFQEFRCCSPADPQWEENLALVLDGFFSNKTRASKTRLQALKTIMDAYVILDLVAEDAEHDTVPQLARSVLRDIVEETDVLVLDAVISLMTSIVTSCDMELFEHIVSTLRGIIDNDRLRSPISPPMMAQNTSTDADKPEAQQDHHSPSSVVTKGYVKMLVQVMNSNGAKSVKLFKSLVYVARSNHCEVDARLTAMKLLFRLRADWANRIFITKELETDFLAVTICRTEASFAKKQAEELALAMRTSRSEQGGLTRSARGVSFSHGPPPERTGSFRSASGPRGIAGQYHQMWKLPDPDALPDDVPSLISTILTSHDASRDQAGGNEGDDEGALQTFPLDVASWLDCVLSILGGSDWEIYSFVLVHLPSQLSNHAIFKDAIPQVQELRKLICEHIRTPHGFQDPPNASGLRKADVAICLFHSLTMILSYHDHFQKGEEDDIVRTFVHGIRTWERTATCCIHALSICCHELPLSASKSLGQMLNQMAAIITQPSVAIHILEFLACLSRLHDVYVNFREEEYRTVFAICFRYLEYARDKRQASRASVTSETSNSAAASTGEAHPSATDDLPQYVYSLAYHVILFWFLALKLPDRANHVGLITKKLFADVDGSGSMAEEQAFMTIDFMQRATYADVDESGEDPLFNEQRYGEMATRQWLVGNSIITVKQSIKTGWAQITKRQPSGTSAYMVREAFRPPPLHQTRNPAEINREGQESGFTVLPSHLLVQLMSSIPQSCDTARPIPLPDGDDTTERTLRVFDRNPTVDGHKVGVIYIGEGQTHETEILANVSGSSDYADFLNNLGTLTRLKGATFNTQGLDKEMDIDGEYAFCWRDRLTEIIFHVTTQMPTNLERDPQVSMKKRHIGNDFVNIIFNDSGLPFKFDTFPSQFNFVNIVITPASRASFIATREARRKETQEQPFYKVQVMSKPGFPEISPASETKIVSLHALPEFIRLLALNASVFSLVWQNRAGGEHISPWRNRLREIKRLREKHGPKTTAVLHQHQHGHQHLTSPSPPPMSTGAGVAQHQLHQQPQFPPPSDSSRPSSSVRDSFTSLRRTSVATFFTSSTSEQTSLRSSTLSGSAATTNDTEIGGAAQHGSEALIDSVDFSRWA